MLFWLSRQENRKVTFLDIKKHSDKTTQVVARGTLPVGESAWETGVTVGIYSGLVDTLWTNYVRPQENGNRDGVRWV